MPAPPLKKSLGQHHLVDGRLCRPLLEFLRPAGSTVLEIGPGGGVLTRELLAAGARVIGWELDVAWARELCRRLGRGSGGRLAVVEADALAIPWTRLPASTLVAGNLPFNVGTLIIEQLLVHHQRVPRAAFLVQKEVAERLLAPPGKQPYGALTVLVAARARVVALGRVRPGSFRPPPKVEGAFIGLNLQPPPLPEAEMPAFNATVRLAFGQRRKTLRNALGAGWGLEATRQALAAAEVDPGLRAEDLDLEAYLRLHRARREGLAAAQ